MSHLNGERGRDFNGVRGLPAPNRTRWQPLRAGLVDLFYYEQEEFAFRDGRLLLRGNNGTGKSKVLALTLPFLLDGELGAHRVEPDADPKKRMEWNLLLGGEHPHDERVGYSWIEFGRLDEHAGPQYCTVAVGMKAVRGRGIADHWFLLTAQRVGADLEFVDSTRVALGFDRLADAVAAHGSVYRGAAEHRRRLDERLFGLGQRRYRSLIDLLIKIRAPQLSKRPDERGLSAALTDSLPTLDHVLLQDVSDAFRALEDDRAELSAMVEGRDAAGRYLDTYRQYTRVLTRRRATPIRRIQTVFDRVSRELTEASTARDAATKRQEEAARDRVRLEQQTEQLNVRERVLNESPEARDASNLERARDDSASRRHTADQAADVQHSREATLADRRERERHAAERVGAAGAVVRAQAETVAEYGARSRLEGELARVVSVPAHEASTDQLRRVADEAVLRQRGGLRQVRARLADVDQAEHRLRLAREQRTRLEDDANALDERRALLVDALSAAGAGCLSEVRSWLAGLTELIIDDIADLLSALEGWIESLAGDNPVAFSAVAAGRRAAARLAREREQREADLGATSQEAERLAAEVARLEAGGFDHPPVPHTRASEGRDAMAGAPLWQCVDFAASVAGDARAGLEAALESSGLLDAWIAPDGSVLDADLDDVLLSPTGDPLAHSLTRVLVPAIDHADHRAATLSDETVADVLGRIGLGEQAAAVWVSPDGRFRNGALTGAWHKPAAAFVGHGARERARRLRLEELRTASEDLAARITELKFELRDLADRDARLTQELDAVPRDANLRAAHADLSRVDAERAALGRQLATARETEAGAAQERDAARDRLVDDARDLALPSEADELEQVEQGLVDVVAALAGLWPALEELTRAGGAYEVARADVFAAESELAAEAGRVREAEQAAFEAEERFATLEETVGAAVEELRSALREVTEQRRTVRQAAETADRAHTAATLAAGEARGRSKTLEAQLAEVTERRAHEVETLARFVATGIVGVAVAGLDPTLLDADWNVTAALRLARHVEQELESVAAEDDVFGRWQRRVNDDFAQLADALRRHGNDASSRMEEDGIVVEVSFRGRITDLASLFPALAAEVTEREQLLGAREREILENHLVSEVASALAELISATERQLAQTNRELAERPTSAGMRLRLGWEIDRDGPDGLAEARSRLLRQRADAWSEADRSAVGAFLQGRIEAVRAAGRTHTWIEHLTEALDYRQWHRFVIERHQNGRWVSAAGPASGGERVLAASVPLFAAASSYYRSATNPHAPRLVLLDEAFAGVDDDSRAKCFGLLAAFDLDVMLTSEREWGCYAEVPGLAIAQLSRVDGVAAVLVSRWEWDGADLRQVEGGSL